MKLVFASNNKHKIEEFSQLLPKGFELLSLEDIGCNEDIIETSDTIEGNAQLKANYITRKYGYNCFADDTGLEVETLNGAPGVHSARYAGEQKNDEHNINKLLETMQDATNRKAQFKTVIALNLNNTHHLFTGIVKGEIFNERRGTNGFGYDPIFIPEGSHLTFAEQTSQEKNKISHRGKAVKDLIAYLNYDSTTISAGCCL